MTDIKLAIVVHNKKLTSIWCKDFICLLLGLCENLKLKLSSISIYFANKNEIPVIFRLLKCNIIVIDRSNFSAKFSNDKYTYVFEIDSNNKISLLDSNISSLKFSSDFYCFRKINEKTISPTFNQGNLRFKTSYYISGYCKKRPDVSLLVGPAWSWMKSEDLKLSGVNFLPSILRNLPKKKLAKYRCIYIGSSSLNKNSLLALFILVTSRLIARLRGENIKRDLFILFKFYGIKGAIIWWLNNILIWIFKILKVGIDFRLSSKYKISHSQILMDLSGSSYCLIPYLKEGFPRVLGEALMCKTLPLVWSRTTFGDGDIKRSLESISILKIFKILSFSHTFNVNFEEISEKIFLNPQDLKNRIKKSELNSFLNQYSILDTENRNSIFTIY